MVLGKKQNKGERCKAIPETYTEEGPIDIIDAYQELSKSAFAVWIRLSVSSQEQLGSGRKNLSKILGYSYNRSNAVLYELEKKGFVVYLPGGPWKKTKFKVIRKPLLRRGHGFVKWF